MNVNIVYNDHNLEDNPINHQQQNFDHSQSSTQKENMTSYYDSENGTESKTDTLSKS